jgi:hypothetical protein
MQLRSKLTNEALIVYREKWGTLTFAAALGLACLAFGIGFHRLMRDAAGAPGIPLLLFCAVFVLAGGLILLSLPRHARRLRVDDGLHVLVADAAGIALTPNLGAATQRIAWSAVTEIVVAERLRIVDADETSFLRRTVVVFVSTDGAANWLERTRSGIATSGTGRSYLLGDYPRGQGRTVRDALNHFGAGAVNVRLCTRAVLDRKTGADTLTDP